MDIASYTIAIASYIYSFSCNEFSLYIMVRCPTQDLPQKGYYYYEHIGGETLCMCILLHYMSESI